MVDIMAQSKHAFRPLMQIAIVLIMTLSSLAPANALYVTSFSGGGAQSTVAFTSPGTDNNTNIMVPVNGTVTWAALRTAGKGTNLSVDVGQDGTVDWAYTGKGYGRLGQQLVFSDDSSQWSVGLGQNQNSSRFVMLPYGAVISKAVLHMTPRGTANLTWSSDRYFTVQDGSNIVELGFKDKAYLSPEYKDLDQDGNPDLLVSYQTFGSAGAGSLAFYNGKAAGSSPKLEQNTSTFSTVTPSCSYVHPVMADVDSDGDNDLIYGCSDGTIKFYKHDGTIQNPAWTLNATLFGGINVGSYAAPTFVDLHGDNKLDLVIGNGNGDFVLYNNTGSVGTPVFTFVPGFFAGIHIASGYATPSFGDMDNDNDLDMVSGNANGDLLMFQNNGTRTLPLIQANTVFFDGVTAISTRSSPVTYDAEGDGDLDVITGYANPRLVIWKNQKADGLPKPWGLYNLYNFGNLTLHSQSSAIEMADLNGDGLDDLVEVTDDSKFFAWDQKISSGQVQLGTNTSTFSGYQDITLADDPTFADLDGDGDLDMLCGNAGGTLTFFRNTGNKNAPVWQKVVGWAPVAAINVGSNSAPELGDINGDNLPDLILGANDGSLKYYMNTGNQANPVFTLNNTLLGSISYGANGRAVPEFVDLDGDGDLDLMVTYATLTGYSTVPDYYENTGAPKAPTYFLKNSVIGGTGYIIQRPHIGLLDYDLDGDKDLLMGNEPIQRPYYLTQHSHYDIKVSVATVSFDYHAETVAKTTDITISNQVVQALGAATTIQDPYGNSMASLKLDVKALRGFGAKFTIQVDYTYATPVQGLVKVMNDYITAHKAQADQNGMIEIPVKVACQSDGSITLSNLNITLDQPPRLVRSLTAFSMDEDTKNDKVVDAWQLFDDDFTADKDLVIDFAQKSPKPVVALLQNRYISVDDTPQGPFHWFGKVPVIVNVTDALGHKSTTGWFNITVRHVNHDPVIHTVAPTKVVAGQVYSYQVNATDIDNDMLVYSLSIYPKGMNINSSSGSVKWTPIDSDVGPHAVTLTVSDGPAVIEQNFTISVTQRPAVNHPPAITSTPVTVAYVGRLYEYDVLATDEEGDTLQYLIPPSLRPNGLGIDSKTGVITWIPSEDQLGQYNLIVIVADPYGNTTQNFTLNVEIIDLPPKLTSTPVTTANVDVTYSYKVTATDPENGVLSYSLGTKPTGMTINAATGLISWIPDASQVGTVLVKVVVSDARNKVNQSFNIMVSFVQPQIYLSQPRDKDKVSGTLTVKGTARVSVGALVKVQVKVDSKDWVDASGTGNWTYKLDTKKLTNGPHTVTVRAQSDRTESEMKTVNVEVKNENTGVAGSMMTILLVVLVVVIVVVVVVVVFIMKRKKAKPALETRHDDATVATPPPVQSYTQKEQVEQAQGIPTDDEMEADMAAMADAEATEAPPKQDTVPTEQEVQQDLKDLEQVENSLADKEQK
jgi:hypothetical protein